MLVDLVTLLRDLVHYLFLCILEFLEYITLYIWEIVSHSNLGYVVCWELTQSQISP